MSTAEWFQMASLTSAFLLAAWGGRATYLAKRAEAELARKAQETTREIALAATAKDTFDQQTAAARDAFGMMKQLLEIQTNTNKEQADANRRQVELNQKQIESNQALVETINKNTQEIAALKTEIGSLKSQNEQLLLLLKAKDKQA